MTPRFLPEQLAGGMELPVAEMGKMGRSEIQFYYLRLRCLFPIQGEMLKSHCDLWGWNSRGILC